MANKLTSFKAVRTVGGEDQEQIFNEHSWELLGSNKEGWVRLKELPSDIAAVKKEVAAQGMITKEQEEAALVKIRAEQEIRAKELDEREKRLAKAEAEANKKQAELEQKAKEQAEIPKSDGKEAVTDPNADAVKNPNPAQTQEETPETKKAAQKVK